MIIWTLKKLLMHYIKCEMIHMFYFTDFYQTLFHVEFLIK